MKTLRTFFLGLAFAAVATYSFAAADPTYQCLVHGTQGCATETVESGGTIEVLSGGTFSIASGATYTIGAAGTTTVGVGTAGTNVTATEQGGAVVHKTILTMSALSLVSTDHTTNGASGSQLIYTFPEGVIQILGSSCNLTTARVSTGIATNAAVVESLGSAAAGADDTLSSTEADIIASYAGTLSSGAGVFTKYGSIVTAAFDGHSTPTPVYLNFAMPDAGTSANDHLTFTGTCTLVWSNLGDF